MTLKRAVKWAGVALTAVVVVLLLFVGVLLIGYERAVAKRYDVPPPSVISSTDSAVVARGKHLAESIGGCLDCHGPGLGGREGDDMGPVGAFHAPNITRGEGGVGDTYTDAEMARLVRHGIKSDGRTVLFMPSMDFNWWPDEDLTALVSYVRSLPPVDGKVRELRVGLLGKSLNQLGVFPLAVAAAIDHTAERPDVPDPEPTAEYGRFLAMSCQGCHGVGLSGGRLPGSPADLPTPTNLTRHETGLAGWGQEDFVRLLDTGIRPNGSRIDPFMPVTATRNMSEIEKSALWAYLQSLERREFGGR